MEKYSVKDVAPISALPYKTDEIKNAIILAMIAEPVDSTLKLLLTGYMQLGMFIPDDEYKIICEADKFLFSPSFDKSKLEDAQKALEIRKRVCMDCEGLRAELLSKLEKYAE